MQKPADYKRPEVRVRYSVEEFHRLKLGYARTTCNTLGGYVRKVSLGQPVEIVHRNKSFDDFVGEIVLLRKEMAALRQDHRLSPGEQAQLVLLHQKIQTTIDKIVQLCMQMSNQAPASQKR
ncbi:hypothetical protein [Puia dinghuensis]|uniref:Mobilization protein n=1 Tax=Puia dinghuensis TaxID=1792502 RepID=A0A8J2XWI0_9BACT|nr:hypothetical protein [Puia dinghuensis]GGB23926.1 hypothetical protein GCM10011511_54780 [Puia dinghuensis]